MELLTKQVVKNIRCYLITLFLSFLFELGVSQNPDSTRLAQQVDSMVKVHANEIYQDLFQEGAIILFDSMAQIVETSLGRCNWPYIKCKYWKSIPLIHIGRYQEAEIILKEMKSLQETCVGTKWVYGQVLSQLSFIYEETDRYLLAEKTLIEYQEYFKPLTRPYRDIAAENNNFGRFYLKMGLFDKAKSYLLRADSIYIANHDSLNYFYTNNLCLIGNMYADTYDFVLARQYIEKAKRISDQSQYPSERHYIVIIHSLSFLYRLLGEYREEERMTVESLARIKNFYGQNNYQYVLGLLGYAHFLERMGRLAESRDALISAKRIMEELSLQYHSKYAEILLRLNNIYVHTDPEKERLETYQQAIDIMKSLRGAQSIEYASSLMYTCEYYLRNQAHELAEPVLMEVKVIYDEIYGEASLDHYGIFYLLAHCSIAKGYYLDALNHIKSAQSIVLKVFNNHHPIYTDLLTLEAEIQYHLGNTTGLFEAIQTFCSNDQTVLNSSVTFLPEQELSYFIKMFEERLNLTYNFVSLDANKTKEFAVLAYNQVLFYKGYILNSILEWRRVLNASISKSEEMAQMQMQLRGLNARYLDAAISKETDALANLDKEIIQINKVIRDKHPFSALPAIVTYNEVADKLSNNEVAIEFIDFEINGNAVKNPRMLGALVLTSKSVYPTFVSLCKEDQIEKMISKLKKSSTDRIDRLYTFMNSNDTSLYSLIWEPLEPFCKSNKVVYISKSGILNRLNLGAIPVNDGIVLDDQYKIVNLSSTRNLTISKPDVSHQITSVIIGDITYDAYDKDSSETMEYDLAIHREYENLTSHFDSTTRGSDWLYLPGSMKEVENIYNIMQDSDMAVNVLRDTHATEEKIKILGNIQNNNISPRVIHFSTHGYFFPDPSEYPGLNEVSKSDPVFKTAEHPMIRSGLILAGGNYAWKHGHPYKPGMEDGILTAYEISQMDLSNTELVVLSACETGLGDIQGNEGVYGLQRAFKIAGVKNLIMSLWKVPDAATAELMISFYKHWLEDNMTIRQALYTAQKELRDQGFEPFYWAGWVLVE